MEPALAIAQIVETKRIPTIVMTQDPRIAEGRKYIIRFVNPADDYAKALFRYFRANKLKHFGIIKAEMTFANVMVDALKKNLASDESLEIIQTVIPSDQDFNTLVAKLRLKNFDVFGLYLIPSQVISFCRQYKTQRLKLPIFGSTVLESIDAIRQCAGVLDSSVFSHIYVEDTFHNRYQKALLSGRDLLITR